MMVIIRKVEIIISTMEIIHVGEGDDHNSIGEHHNERRSIIKWEVAFPDEGRGLSPYEKWYICMRKMVYHHTSKGNYHIKCGIHNMRDWKS